MVCYKIGWNIIRNGELNKKTKCSSVEKNMLVDLLCLGIIFTTWIEHLHSVFQRSSLFNTNKIMYFFFSFCLSLLFHGKGIYCWSPAVVGEHSTVPLHLISLLHWRKVLTEMFSAFITPCTKIFWEKIQMRVKEVYF